MKLIIDIENTTEMENRPDDVATEAVVSKWRKLVRQQSAKIVTLADNVVLPKNERLARLASRNENVEMQSIDEEHPQTPKVITEKEHPRKKAEHFPIFMIAISLLQIIIYYCFDKDLLSLKFGYDPHRRHEIWRFLTCTLVHANGMHLLGNLVFQLILGVLLEIVHEWKRIALVYFASAFGGSLCVTVLANTGYGLGASGAVMGLLLAHLATITLNWNEIERKFSRLFCLSLYIVYNVGVTVYNELLIQKSSDIGHAAHFGGAFTGFLVSILVLKNFKKHPWEDTMQKICLGILIAIFIIVFVMNVTLSDYFPHNEWNFDYNKTYYEEYIDTYESTTPYNAYLFTTPYDEYESTTPDDDFEYYDWNVGKLPT